MWILNSSGNSIKWKRKQFHSNQNIRAIASLLTAVIHLHILLLLELVEEKYSLCNTPKRLRYDEP